MINRDSFIKIVNELDEFFNGEVREAFEMLGIYDNRIQDEMDKIIAAIDNDVDPLHLAQEDKFASFSGSYLCEWLFGMSSFNEECPTGADLYDYICAVYASHAEQVQQQRVNEIKEVTKSTSNI
jgi:hypothetical protein